MYKFSTIRRRRFKRDKEETSKNDTENAIKTFTGSRHYTNIPKIQIASKTYINEKYMEEMEDIILINQNFNDDKNQHLFCIFDGHCGDETAILSSEYYPKIFLDLLKKYPNNIEKCLNESFIKLDEKTKKEEFDYIGNTATVVFIDKNILYCANVGDSRCVLIGYDKPYRMSYDDKVSDESEMKRIIKAGGKIRKKRINGELAISRGIGDHEYKKYGLICTPHINKKVIGYNEKYCIIASDGIWDYVCDETAYNISMNIDKGKDLCEKLVNVAINIGSQDNISVIVLSFREN